MEDVSIYAVEQFPKTMRNDKAINDRAKSDVINGRHTENIIVMPHNNIIGTIMERD
jgi:hypothetical protein